MENEIKQDKPKKSIWKKWWFWLIILLIIITSVFGYSQRQEAINTCKRNCFWSSASSIGGERWTYKTFLSFPTQEQCIDYCLSQ